MKRKIILISITGLVAATMIACGIAGFWQERQDYKNYEQVAEEIKEQLDIPSASNDSDGETQKPAEQNSSSSQKKVPQNMVGWIEVPGSNIDYPIMSATDDYYLTHDPYGRKTICGSVFCYASQNLAAEEQDKNIVIFGHRISNNKMFGYLDVICRKGIINDPQKNKIIITTKFGAYQYEMFSAYRTTANENFGRVNFENSEDFRAYCNMLLQKSETPKSGTMSFEASDHVITLVTCARGNDKNRRAVVHAKLVDFKPAEQEI